MSLQILVNHYMEDEAIINRFLHSLEYQKGVKFSVLFCSDGGIKLNDEFFTKFNLDIEYEYLPHTGVCHTRNVLMDKSNTDYIMFCDVDDCFIANDGLLSLMSVANETKADIIGSPYLYEIVKNNHYIYETLEKDTVRLHGKIFRKQYLIDNNIRFPDELETSGDMAFLWLSYALTKNIAWIKNVFYAWKNNPNSVTRGVDNSMVYHYPRTLKCYNIVHNELIKRNRPDLNSMLASTVVPMTYIDYLSPLWQQASEEEQKLAKEAVIKCLKWSYKLFEALSFEKQQLGFKTELIAKRVPEGSISFDGISEWANKILNDNSKNDILIIGKGIVGTNLANELIKLNPDIYDKYKNIDTRTSDNYKIAFICVDTPYTNESPCDISEVRAAIMDNNADIYVIKSTILPGITDILKTETGKHIIFSPEYYGATQHCNNFDFDFTILGGNKEDCVKVQQILQKVYDGRHTFRIVDSKTAELTKYMENCWLATKVSFCNQFYDIANSIGINYEELRELFILDPRVNPSHTFVYNDHPYWESHCLDKDVRAIGEIQKAPLLNAIIDFNEKRKIKENV